MTLQSLLDKRVVTADGVYLGRVFDFRGQHQGAGIRVTHLRVGAAAWIARFRLEGLMRWLLRPLKGVEVPWELIASVDREIRLKHPWDQVRCELCITGPEEPR